MPAAFKWTAKQIQDMIATYNHGENLDSIARRYGTSHQVISPVLKRHGLVIRPQSENKRRHTCDYGYFHTIDTEEKAYWLGFLTADGCITTGNRITVHLASIDCGHLYKLKTALRATQMVSEDSKRCSLVICSPELAADLAIHGLVPRKTFSTIPAQVAPELARHYWRGVIDGDGHISKDGNVLALVGDDAVILGFQAFVLSHCPKVKARVARMENIYKFAVTGKSCLLMLRLLYEGATVFLDRKYEGAQEILNN